MNDSFYRLMAQATHNHRHVFPVIEEEYGDYFIYGTTSVSLSQNSLALEQKLKEIGVGGGIYIREVKIRHKYPEVIQSEIKRYCRYLKNALKSMDELSDRFQMSKEEEEELVGSYKEEVTKLIKDGTLIRWAGYLLAYPIHDRRYGVDLTNSAYLLAKAKSARSLTEVRMSNLYIVFDEAYGAPLFNGFPIRVINSNNQGPWMFPGRALTPHLTDHGRCFGSWQGYISKAIASGSLLSILLAVDNFLRTFNPNSPLVCISSLSPLCKKHHPNRVVEVSGDSFVCLDCALQKVMGTSSNDTTLPASNPAE